MLHTIFKSKEYIKSNFSFDFPKKSEILELMKLIEEKRGFLCYGKRKPVKDIEDAIVLYNKLKEILGDLNE